MPALPVNPLLYEINTWVWLEELGREAGRPLTLDQVPAQAWDRMADLGFDAVWLMGVWERSPEGVAISRRNPGIREDLRAALPDFTDADNVGSPYCVRRYAADTCLGGPEALARAREELARRGLGLILDFVPNHVAPDHPWTTEHPDYFIQGDEDDMAREPHAFIRHGGRVLACGRDPYFPAWPDVAQLNAFAPGLREAAVRTLCRIAGQCDGVRCDMAMLLLNTVFAGTWGQRAGQPPATDYWRQVIPAVRADHPGFRFLAEAYWDMEWELQQQGFDFCYDKRLYDRLEHGPAQAVAAHLDAGLDYQERLVRFIENHDEPRAAAVFDPRRHRASAVAALTLPGAALVHEGQMEGRRVRPPVFLGRRPGERPDRELQAFYEALLGSLRRGGVRRGRWRRHPVSGWPDNASCANLLAWSWTTRASRRLVAVNLSDAPAQGMVEGLWEDMAGSAWRLRDLDGARVFERDGDALAAHGLFVDLPAWGYHVLECERRPAR